jgi:hypothetical protein
LAILGNLSARRATGRKEVRWAALTLLTFGGIVGLYQTAFSVWMAAYPYANPSEWRTRLYVWLSITVVIGFLWGIQVMWLFRRRK